MHEVPTGGIVAHSGLCSESESIRILGGEGHFEDVGRGFKFEFVKKKLLSLVSKHLSDEYSASVLYVQS